VLCLLLLRPWKCFSAGWSVACGVFAVFEASFGGFNRCVLDWFGDWSNGALYSVGQEFTVKIDLDKANYKAPDFLPIAYEALPKPPTHRNVIINAFVFIHQTMHLLNNRCKQKTVTQLKLRYKVL